MTVRSLILRFLSATTRTLACLFCISHTYSSSAVDQNPACSVLMDLVVAIDASGSVGKDNFEKCLKFVHDIAGTADIDSGAVRIGVLTYSSTGTVIFHLNKYTNQTELQAAVTNIYYTGGGTYIGKAIAVVRQMFNVRYGDRLDAENVAFVMTDGRSSDSTDSEAKGARDDGIIIYAFGIGKGASVFDLTNIASKPVDKYLHMVDSFNNLDGLGEKLFSKMCTDISPMTSTDVSTVTSTDISTVTSTDISTVTSTDISTVPSKDIPTVSSTDNPPVAGTRRCMCPCHVLGDKRFVNMTSAEIQSYKEEHRRLLLRDKQTLSAWKGRLSSATDDRHSANVLAVVLVLLLFGVPFISLCVIDLDIYFKWTRKEFGINKVETRS